MSLNVRELEREKRFETSYRISVLVEAESYGREWEEVEADFHSSSRAKLALREWMIEARQSDLPPVRGLYMIEGYGDKGRVSATLRYPEDIGE